MRKILFAMLLAGTAATQAIAAPSDRPAHQTRDVKAKEVHQSRTERVHRDAAERRVANRQVSQNRVQSVRSNDRTRATSERLEQRNRTVEHRVQQVRRAPNLERRRPPVVSSVPRFGTQPPLRVERRSTPRPHWSTNWRNNYRYDWNGWRRHHRSIYHLHSYHDPFGWAYQVFSIGWRLWPAYYGSSYWINDPWMYRLPPPPPGMRWIRYYNDALLVDMWSGEVVDVIHNFFW